MNELATPAQVRAIVRAVLQPPAPSPAERGAAVRGKPPTRQQPRTGMTR